MTTLNGKHALVTGGSRGIGRGIALKLAAEGVRVAVHYYQNEAAKDTLDRVRKHGGDGLLVRADVSRPDEVQRMFGEVQARFGRLDVFVANARPELATFYQKPLEITLEAWDHALDSQAKAFLVGAREAAALMGPGGRIVAVTYAPGARTGTWQPWIAMGAAKAAMESVVRYFAVTLASRGITVNAVSPGLTDDSVLNGLPDPVVQTARQWHASGWTPMGRMGTPADIGDVVALLCTPGGGLDHRPAPPRRRRRVPGGHAAAARDPAGLRADLMSGSAARALGVTRSSSSPSHPATAGSWPGRRAWSPAPRALRSP